MLAITDHLPVLYLGGVCARQQRRAATRRAREILKEDVRVVAARLPRENEKFRLTLIQRVDFLGCRAWWVRW